MVVWSCADARTLNSSQAQERTLTKAPLGNYLTEYTIYPADLRWHSFASSHSQLEES